MRAASHVRIAHTATVKFKPKNKPIYQVKREKKPLAEAQLPKAIRLTQIARKQQPLANKLHATNKSLFLSQKIGHLNQDLAAKSGLHFQNSAAGDYLGECT